MKNLMVLVLILIGFASCNSSKTTTNSEDEVAMKNQDTVRIENEELEYEIIIIEPGFNTWLLSRARPEGYYSQTFLEGRNHQYVIAYNQRVLNPSIFNPNLYEQRIDYDPNIDYGYEVNYKLYYYFVYFQLQYNQRLTGLTPRI